MLKKKALSKEDNARKQQASDILKNADKLLKAGELDEALVEIDKTIELDPQNFYARALKERLKNMQRKGGKTAPADAKGPPQGRPAVAAGSVHAPAGTAPASGNAQKPGSAAGAAPAAGSAGGPESDAGASEAQRRRAEESKLRESETDLPSPETGAGQAPPAGARTEDGKKAEEARRKTEEELKRRMLELEIVHRREEEQRMKTEQERARAAEAQRRLVEDMRRRDAEAAKRLEEERGKTEVEKKRIEEEYRQKALQEKARLEEEAQRRLNEEKQRLEEEARKRAEQDARVKLEEEKRRLEEENRRRIAEEQRAKHEEEQRREAAAAEERKRAEAESRRKEDDAARLRVEQELRKRLEEEKQRKQEEEQVLAAAREEGKRQAVETKAAEFLAAARQHFAQKAYDKTLVETAKIKSIDPAHAGAAEIEASVRKAQSDLLAAQVESARKIPRETLAAMYVRSLREGMSDGLLTTEENLILLEWRGVLGIGEEDHKKLELKAKLDIYADALRESWQGGSISRAAADHLEQMRADLQITTEQHLSVEQQVRKGS